jgi:hypothetical protein
MQQPEWWDTLNYESETITRFDLAWATIEAEARVTRTRAELGLQPRRHAKRELKLLENEASRLENSFLADTR